jgi:hypothetical protein
MRESVPHLCGMNTVGPRDSIRLHPPRRCQNAKMMRTMTMTRTRRQSTIRGHRGDHLSLVPMPFRTLPLPRQLGHNLAQVIPVAGLQLALQPNVIPIPSTRSTLPCHRNTKRSMMKHCGRVSQPSFLRLLPCAAYPNLGLPDPRLPLLQTKLIQPLYALFQNQ